MGKDEERRRGLQMPIIDGTRSLMFKGRLTFFSGHARARELGNA
jgi:hypothetical protein